MRPVVSVGRDAIGRVAVMVIEVVVIVMLVVIVVGAVCIRDAVASEIRVVCAGAGVAKTTLAARVIVV